MSGFSKKDFMATPSIQGSPPFSPTISRRLSTPVTPSRNVRQVSPQASSPPSVPRVSEVAGGLRMSITEPAVGPASPPLGARRSSLPLWWAPLQSRRRLSEADPAGAAFLNDLINYARAAGNDGLVRFINEHRADILLTRSSILRFQDRLRRLDRVDQERVALAIGQMPLAQRDPFPRLWCNPHR